MTILIIHNEYSFRGGEESIVKFQKQLFEAHENKVILYIRKYDEMKKWLFGKFWGTFTSIFNPKSLRELNVIIEKEKPDIVLLHNLFPIISPSIIPFLKRKNVKVFQMVHNYRTLCPIGIFYQKGEICEKCTTKWREWNCVKNCCTGTFLSSISYFVRAFITRKLGYYNHVDLFLSLTQFQKNKLIENGYNSSKIKLLPHCLNVSDVKTDILSDKVDAIGFIGRLTEEKGFLDFIEIAKKIPYRQFIVAGDNSKILNNLKLSELPENISFEGFLTQEQIPNFYKRCKVILFLSKLYEGFGLIMIESMSYGIPVIVYNLAAMPEIIENEKEGFVVNKGDFETISEKINLLFQNNDLFQKISNQCLKKFSEKYTSEKYYDNFLNICNNQNNGN